MKKILLNLNIKSIKLKSKDYKIKCYYKTPKNIATNQNYYETEENLEEEKDNAFMLDFHNSNVKKKEKKFSKKDISFTLQLYSV